MEIMLIFALVVGISIGVKSHNENNYSADSINQETIVEKQKADKQNEKEMNQAVMVASTYTVNGKFQAEWMKRKDAIAGGRVIIKDTAEDYKKNKPKPYDVDDYKSREIIQPNQMNRYLK